MSILFMTSYNFFTVIRYSGMRMIHGIREKLNLLMQILIFTRLFTVTAVLSMLICLKSR